MKIKCLHGFFILDESYPGEAGRFTSRFGFELAPWREKFTFAPLELAPEFCIGGSTYLAAAVANTYAGEPWEIMAANNLIYNFNTGLLVQKASISILAKISQAGNVIMADGLIMPGSITESGKFIYSYSGHFSFDTMRFRYSEVTYD